MPASGKRCHSEGQLSLLSVWLGVAVLIEGAVVVGVAGAGADACAATGRAADKVVVGLLTGAAIAVVDVVGVADITGRGVSSVFFFLAAVGCALWAKRQHAQQCHLESGARIRR